MDLDELTNKYGSGIARRCLQLNEEPEQVHILGTGENTLVLYRFSDGQEVFMTNGDPVWQGEGGFDELRKECP